MSEDHLDEYEHYNFEQDKITNTGHSGKQRSKKEVSDHTNKTDPGGHTRKLVKKMENTEKNRKDENLTPHPATKK